MSAVEALKKICSVHNQGQEGPYQGTVCRIRQSATRSERNTHTTRATSLSSDFTATDTLPFGWLSELDRARGAISGSRGSNFTGID